MVVDEDDEEEEAKDLRIIEEADLDKPEKPKFVDDSEARQRVTEKFEQIRRRPGEPKLFPELSAGMAITKNEDCPK